MSRRGGARSRGGALLGALLAFACHHAEPTPEVHARFGVFFGGDVQEREQIPLIVDRARQTIGVRLEFSTAPSVEQRVTWELDKPTGKKPGDTSRVVAYGETKTRIGAAVQDVPLAFQPGDRTGAWRVRVAVDGRRVLERPFTVTPSTDQSPDE